jgi:hypothetical protein
MGNLLAMPSASAMASRIFLSERRQVSMRLTTLKDGDPGVGPSQVFGPRSRSSTQPQLERRILVPKRNVPTWVQMAKQHRKQHTVEIRY